MGKAKQKVCDELFERLDANEGEKDLFPLMRQTDRAGKDVLQIQVIKDREGNLLISEGNML